MRRTKHLAPDSVYTDDVATMLSHLDHNERTGISAETVAATIVRAIDARRPKQFYAVGSGAPWVFGLKRALPRETVSHIVARRHGLRR